MFMERTPRILLMLALMTTAAPAVASDFSGIIAFIFAPTLLIWIAVAMGAILLRRFTLHRTGALRYLPAAMLLVAGAPLALLGMFAMSYAAIAAIALAALWLWAAWNFWCHPYGRAAAYTARVMLLIIVAIVGLIFIDLYHASYVSGRLLKWLWMLILLAGLVATTLYLCVKVSNLTTKVPGRVERQSTADNSPSPGGT